MNVLLIAPRMGLRPMDSEFKRMMAPSLALATLAGLTPARHHVRIHDENVDPRSPDPPESGPWDLVGITSTVTTAPRAYAVAETYRTRGAAVVLGGIHPSACPEEALEHADAVCVGPAEGAWESILRDAEAGRLEGRYRADSDSSYERAWPEWGLVDTKRYLAPNIVAATRGCAHRCGFCYNSCDYVRGGHRTPPVSEVIEAIRRLETRQVMFIDDNLLGTPAWTWELTASLKELDVTWHAAVSADVGRYPDLLDAMAESGCRSLFIGIESLNPKALIRARKHQNRVERYAALAADLHARDIMLNASLAFGFDEDGPEVFDHTVRWLLEQRVDTMTAHILTPYPGTELFERLHKEGRITDYDWSHYDTAHVVFRPKKMTAEELKAGYLSVYRRFYSVSGILRRAPRRRANAVPYFLFNVAYRKFGRVTSLLGRGGRMQAVGRLARRLAYGVR